MSQAQPDTMQAAAIALAATRKEIRFILAISTTLYPITDRLSTHPAAPSSWSREPCCYWVPHWLPRDPRVDRHHHRRRRQPEAPP